MSNFDADPKNADFVEKNAGEASLEARPRVGPATPSTPTRHENGELLRMLQAPNGQLDLSEA